ncbi:unnamed protein product [Lymnaea stagnalis]|uniref:DDB1-and CUL4-associated factor 5 n=1 Tax=Lymnaea stagnalis TaxID=6523 RepID=A0AAV2HM95_LYMST
MESLRNGYRSASSSLMKRERDGTSLSSLKQSLFGHRLAQSQSLFKIDLRGHYGCVNAIEYSTDGEFIASGGDDRRLLLWNVGQTIFDNKGPSVIDTQHISNINSCCFDAEDKKVATGGRNDGQVIVHDFSVQMSTIVCGLNDAIYCLSPDPINATIIATASDDGKAQILDTRMPKFSAPFVLADQDAAMHSIMYNPMDPVLLATANSKHGIGLWDIRMPLKALNYKSGIQNCMSVRFNSRGDRLLALRRRSSPVLYDIGKMHPIYEFDYKTYYNACTLKSCSFAGLHDEYIMSGSDDFCVYLWKIPSELSESYTQTEPHMILRGHRSIVNQVRYCPHSQFIISSGVEKLIKLWSPYSIPNCSGHLVHSRRYGDDEEVERNAYSHEEYIHMVLQAGSFLSHDYTNGSTDEEPCMIAFFDSLIQREIEQSVEKGDDTSSDGNKSDDGGGGWRSAGKNRLARSPVLETESAAASSIPLPASRSSEGDDPNNTQDTTSSNWRLSRPSYRDLNLDSSSDSDSEVDEILSAMYSRYLTSRAMTSGPRLPGKKISSVIAKGKLKDFTSKRSVCPRRLRRIREDLQHSGDQYLRDNATSVSILADVIDNFVDNLVSNEFNNSRTFSDTNDGHMSTDSGSNNPSETSSLPEEATIQTVILDESSPSRTSLASSQETQAPPLPSISTRPRLPVSLDAGLYFMPELQAFAPESFNAVLNLDLAQNTFNGSAMPAPSNSVSSSRATGDQQSGRKTKSSKAAGSTSKQAMACTSKNSQKVHTKLPVSNTPFGSISLERSNSDESFRAFIRKDPTTSFSDNINDQQPHIFSAINRSRAPPGNDGFKEPVCETTAKPCFKSKSRPKNGNSSSSSSGGNVTSLNCSLLPKEELSIPLGKPCSKSRPKFRPKVSNSSSSPSESNSAGLNPSSSSSSEEPPLLSGAQLHSSVLLSGAQLHSSVLLSGAELQSLKSSNMDESLPPNSVNVQFKRTKVRGRRFRVRRSDSRSSSEEEER